MKYLSVVILKTLILPFMLTAVILVVLWEALDEMRKLIKEWYA